MRRLLYLLPLYILLLSAIPCRADDGCCIDEAITTAAHHKDSFPDNNTGLPCSPFFACGGCHGFIVPEAGIFLQHKEIPAVPKCILPAGNTLPGFTSFIWQPPRKCPENGPLGNIARFPERSYVCPSDNEPPARSIS